MVPVKAFNDAVASLVAIDPDWLAPPTDANKLALIINEFTPSDTLAIGDLTLATFPGSTPKLIPVGDQVLIHNDDTDGWGVKLKEPLGGLDFVCSSAPATPETVYGYCLMNNAGDQLIATQRLDVAKVIDQAGDFVTIPSLFGFLPAEPFNAE